MNHTAEVAAVPVAPHCDKCDYKAAYRRGLITHTMMKHGTTRLTPSSPETLRGPGQMRPAPNTSPILQANREENCHNCGGSYPTLPHICVKLERLRNQLHLAHLHPPSVKSPSPPSHSTARVLRRSCQRDKKLCEDCCYKLGVCPLYATVATK